MVTKAGSSHLTVHSLKDLGLFTQFDVSKWASDRGMSSVYLVHIDRRRAEWMFTAMEPACWKVMDARLPGKVLAHFAAEPDESSAQLRQRAVSWTEAKYDIPLKYLKAVGGFFPAPAVDLLMEELQTLIKVWGPNPSGQVPLVSEAVVATSKKVTERV